jgi:fructuronate reductase/mannitol 2-dehydrogenase
VSISNPIRARPLCAASLAHHSERVGVPRYDRSALRHGVVHISVGSFHRAHQAVYFDDLARCGERDWGVTGVSLHRPEIQEALAAQDGLYTVLTRGADGERARVVGALRQCLYAPRDREAVMRTLAHQRTRLVTLTITADGYKLDPDGRGLRSDDPELIADRAHPDHPVSALGHLVEALSRRRRAGLRPFTVLSCDNLPRNGALTRAALVAAARLRDPGLAAWIDATGAFPSSMVDRITPQASLADRRLLQRQFGVLDRCPVVTEPFSQWVVEDEFSCGRPPLEAVGVRFVGDVAPYALWKTRLLNAAHCALGHLGGLAGYPTTADAMADPALSGLVEALFDEVAPLLPELPGAELTSYTREIVRRLRNPAIADRLSRLRRNGSDKMPAHVLSSLREARSGGRPHPALLLATAAWLRTLHGEDDRGEPFALDDPRADELRTRARRAGDDPRPFVGDRSLFGPVTGDPGLADDLAAMVASLRRHGARAVAARVASAPVPSAVA